MPLIHDHFNPRPASEAMLPVGERLPVMPVIGAQGEMVYYVPGNTPGLPALGGGVPSAGVRLDPNDLICDLQMLQHASPEGLMMPAPTNSLLPLNGSNATMLQSVDLVSNNAGSIVQSSQVQHITNTCLVQHQNNSEVAKNMIQATNQIKDSSKQSKYLKRLKFKKIKLSSPYYAEACNEWRGPSPPLSAWVTAPKKRRSGAGPLTTLCPICMARESNPRPTLPLAMSLATTVICFSKENH